MLALFISTFLLGIAGIDPLGAILIASAIAAGMSRLKIIVFTISVFIFTVFTGVFFSYVGTNFISNIRSSLPEQSSSFWAYLNILIIFIICFWLARRLRSNNKETKPKKPLTGSIWVIFIAGVAFGVGALFDPTFLAVVSLAGQTGNIATILGMHVIWILVSQIMLFALFTAYLFGKHERLLEKSKEIWGRHKALLNKVLYIAAFLAVGILIIDTIVFFIQGAYVKLPL